MEKPAGSILNPDTQADLQQQLAQKTASILLLKKQIATQEEELEKYRRDFSILHTIFESPTNIIIFALDRNYCYTAFTQFHKETIKKIWGVEIQIGMNILDVITLEEDRLKAKQNFDRALTGESFIVNEEYGDESLYRTFYENFYSAIKDPDGNVAGVSVFVVDITKRSQAIMALRESEEKFRQLVWDMQVGVLLQGPNAEIILCNPKALELLGLTEDQLLGKTPFDPDWNVIHEDGTSFPGPEHPVPQAIATRTPVRNVIMGVHRPSEGDRVWLMVDAQPQLNNDGTVKQVVCSFINITKRKHAEMLLQKSQASLNTAQHIAHIGSWEWDIITETIHCSEELYRIIGIDPETFDHRTETVRKSIHPDDLEKHNSILEESIRGGEVKPFEYRIIREGGEIRHLLGTGTFIYDDNGKPIRGVGTIQDITARKQAEEEIYHKNEELLQLNAEKDRFFSIIAHDLRSPFNAFLGFTRLMVDDLPSMKLDEIQKIALLLRKSATNLYTLLENLLEWSRLQRGLISFKPESFLLMPKINAGMQPVLEPALKKGITIRYDIPEDLVVFADPNMVGSVIRNLASNAVKFTSKNGMITITAKAVTGNTVEISVRDNGIGMNDMLVTNLFKLDPQTNRHGTDNEPSTGLGLIICKELVEKHKGTIRIESEEAKGSTFYFTLPAAEHQ